MKKPIHPVCKSDLETLRVFYYDTEKKRTVSEKPLKGKAEWFYCCKCQLPVLVEYKIG